LKDQESELHYIFTTLRYCTLKNILLLYIVPAPTSVMLSSSTPNIVRPIGSTVILTCTVHVELSTALNDSVIVRTVQSGPDGFTVVNMSQSILGGSHIFTTTARISSFGQAQSGVYSCAATVHFMPTTTYNTTNSSTIVDCTHITTGEI
jgi:hypothetical protein